MSSETNLTERRPPLKERFNAWRDRRTQGHFGGVIMGGVAVKGEGFHQTVYLNGPASEEYAQLVNDDGTTRPLTNLSVHSPNDILQLRYNQRLVWRAPASIPPPGLGLICEWPKKTYSEDTEE